ncbi:MAG: glycosyltransferase family 87 protein, partial [Ignavibacteria bacterium]|nr:glycosyltransferase family 87 protein [Ignavibacteria bacterium]
MTFKAFLKKSFSNEKSIYLLYIVVFSLATLHRIFFTETPFNNYDIFRYSFSNLLDNNNLYLEYPEYYFDLYKYNPSFAVFMAPFWLLPKGLGVIIWNLINALLPVYAVNKLKIPLKAKVFFAFFILIELLTSIQNAQSNGLMLGLMILLFVQFENKNTFLAALMMILGFFIKIFVIVGGILFLFYPSKKQFILWSGFLVIGFGVLPAFFIGFESLVQQYQNWWQLLINDKPHELNYSIMSFFEKAVNIHIPQIYYLLFGTIVLLLPLLRRQFYSNFTWRITYLSAILVWVVIFNHKAESPTFVIAMAGAALWFLASKKTTFRWSLL